MATSGLGPASANASASAMGLLSMRSTPSSSPAWLSRTTNDRCRCRSTDAYCPFTGPLLARDRSGLETSSVSLERLRAGEGRLFLLVAAIASLRQLATAGAFRRVRQRERGDRSVMPSPTERRGSDAALRRESTPPGHVSPLGTHPTTPRSSYIA